MTLKELARATATGLVLLAAACAAPPNRAPLTQAAEGVAVTVTRDGERWTADYALDRDAPVWAFFRSSLISGSRRPWRLEQWRVETPGVVLERQGAYDILRATDGGPVPRRVLLSFKPAQEDLEADYGVLAFSDGSVALPSGQFDVFPLASIQEARAMPSDLNGVSLQAGPAMVTWRDRAGPVLFRGRRVAQATEADAQTYVLFGQADLIENERLTTVADPALPDWIGDEIGSFAPRVADVYSRRLGPGQTERPTVMISWTGPTDGVSSMGGSVMPGLIAMNFEGVGVLNPTPEMLAVSRWFIGHESAHFWLGQTVRYQFARDAWITEGGADLMAVRALGGLDPAYDTRAELQKEVDDCLRLSKDRGVASAGDRGEHRAYYACGAVFAMAAEGALRKTGGRDVFDFLRPLIDVSREDGVLTRDEWLAELTRVSGDPSLAPDIARLLGQGASDPAAVIARLFQRTGVAHRRDGDRILLS